MVDNKKIGTFTLNNKEPIHRWYKYDEGYSRDFILNEIEKLPVKINSLFEPFAGSGTTPLVASYLGINTYYTESNPFMRFVTNTKIEITRNTLLKKDAVFKELRSLIDSVVLIEVKEQVVNNDFQKYYKSFVFNTLQDIKKLIANLNIYESKQLSYLALSAIVLTVSNMKKHGDLRYAKPEEKRNSDFDVITKFINKLETIISDIDDYQNVNFGKSVCVGNDARTANLPEKVDCIITSPPYLNGTNYIRNTKLELNILDFIVKESDLKNLHSTGIISGINNVSKRNIVNNKINLLDDILKELEPVSYDSRISKMIVGYFNDMDVFFKNASTLIKDQGIMIIDIGDSQFAGVHIPTHNLLTEIAKKYNFQLYDEEILRKRYSKNKMILSQRVLRYQLKKDKQ